MQELTRLLWRKYRMPRRVPRELLGSTYIPMGAIAVLIKDKYNFREYIGFELAPVTIPNDVLLQLDNYYIRNHS